ncbi:MAG: alpha/beta fold hydrolase [Bryobacteraceae bacterium]
MILPSNDVGAGDPVILFLHHFGGSARQWTEVITTLAAEHRCVAVDMPGFGEAASLTGFTVEEMVDQLAALIQKQAFARFVVVGHSMTGKVALAFAARQPAGLLGLVLVTPSPPGPEPIEDEAREEMLQSHGTRSGAERLISKITARQLPPDLYECAIEDNLRASPEAWEAWLKRGSYEDWSDRVGTLECPTLIVTGQDDPALPAPLQRRLTVPHLAHARLVDLPNCGHLPPLEAPAALSRVLKEFMRVDVKASEPIAPSRIPLLNLRGSEEAISSSTRQTLLGFCSIGDYAVIGGCRSAALVSKAGSLDWLCWPCFDSPSLFGALLDREKGGNWQVCPTGVFQASRKYVARTNVLETRFETATGTFLLTDFMPVADEEYKRTCPCPDHEVVRILKCLRGEVEVRIGYNPRPNYGARAVKFVDKGKLGLRAEAGNGMLTLHSQLAFEINGGAACATVQLRAGEILPLSLTFSLESPEILPNLRKSEETLERTVKWWTNWASQCTYQGPYAEEVLRSILVLKLLEFPSTGAFVAAATTSLPEKIGGDSNWDYRYCWLRDASLTIQALCETGYDAEAEAFAEWMLHATRLTQPKLMVMYDVYGNPAKAEKKLEHLSGYRNSRPVHTGNQARKQIQLDTYGEVICGSARVIKRSGQVDKETSKVLIGFGEYVCKHWQDTDAGIWEPRGGPVVHTHSRLLCWVALHELILLHEKKLLNIRKVDGFIRTRALIRKDIETHSWNEELRSYTSEPGSKTLDATLLLMAWHNFDEPSSERLKQTYERAEENLGAGGDLLYRYRAQKEPEEGAFGICSFWAAEYLAMGGGSLGVATKKFEKLLSYANDVGLYAEEIDPMTGDALGNFPQAFTHVGLINAALAIEKRQKSEEARGAPDEKHAVEKVR